MAIRNDDVFTIRNPAGREVDITGDVLRLRALSNEDDTVLVDGQEIPSVEFLLADGDQAQLRSALERNRESAAAIAEVGDVAHERIIQSRAREEELAARWALTRATEAQPGAGARARQFLDDVDGYNIARSAGAPQPYEGEGEVDPAASVGARYDAAAEETNQQLEEVRTKRTKAEAKADQTASDGGPTSF